jgi:carbon starvation protein
MTLLQIVLGSAIVLGLAYRIYGRWLERWLALDPDVVTPAVELRDDVDYEPIEPKFLIGQHFSAIAAAGPVVGPILAGIWFGWAPALLWILIGSIFIGGIHDIISLTASVRHQARSIAEVVRLHMSHQSYLLFLVFIWIALVYIVVAFTDVTAQSFVGRQTLENGAQVTGGGIATSSLLYLLLPLAMGLLLRYTRLSLGMATVIFIPLVGVAIWAGQKLPLDVAALLGIGDQQAVKVWDVALLVYCFAASIAPMWLLLQPRGHLGGYFLFAALGGAVLGILFGGHTVQYPAFIGWHSTKDVPLFPILFVTIACGACSGFHAMIASGTTSKQLKRETDGRVIGYGTMLLEALVAVVSLSCVMMLSPKSAHDAAVLKNSAPNLIYALGLGNFLSTFGLPQVFVVSFGLMAFTTFVYDTLDVCTRLGRYIVQELTGWHDKRGRVVSTALTSFVPLFFVLQTMRDAKGEVVPVWKVFWGLFGASNQLWAALTLIGVTVWLLRTMPEGKRRWVPWVTGVPAVWMYVMSVWAMLVIIQQAHLAALKHGGGAWTDPVAWIAAVLIVLAALVLVEAVRALSGGRPPREERGQPAPTPDLDLWEVREAAS